jgi:hypothetical protein
MAGSRTTWYFRLQAPSKHYLVVDKNVSKSLAHLTLKESLPDVEECSGILSKVAIGSKYGILHYYTPIPGRDGWSGESSWSYHFMSVKIGELTKPDPASCKWGLIYFLINSLNKTNEVGLELVAWGLYQVCVGRFEQKKGRPKELSGAEQPFRQGPGDGDGYGAVGS